MLKVSDIVERLVGLATSHEKRAIVKEACWCLSNITAGNPEQIEMLIKNQEQVTDLMKLSKHSHSEVKE